MFILDTNIFIYYFVGDQRVVDFIDSSLENYDNLAIPTICVVEFLSYPKASKIDKDKFLGLVEQLLILPLDYQNSQIAAQLRLNYRIRLVDSIIAAATIFQKGVLVSRDKDFKKIKEIEVIDL